MPEYLAMSSSIEDGRVVYHAHFSIDSIDEIPCTQYEVDTNYPSEDGNFVTVYKGIDNNFYKLNGE